ncbi:hypothetical protein C4559_01290 [Candidatus Microgenomates bacterium]|nr:MAG: hypothetical protein C4559_01290 [Candidatus Microgenomates bacterium]
MFDLAIAKIVSTPTLSSWSQAYNAGNLFAVLSLANQEETESDTLNLLGKEIIDALEKEYYVLEEKNLASIKEAIIIALKKVPQGLTISLVVAAVVQKNVLYAFSKGNGKVILKRGEKIGKILSSEEEISSSSGFLENEDLLILSTNRFAKIISADELSSALDHLPPSEIAESLSPKVHEEQKGEASAIIISFKKCTPAYEELQEEEEEQKDNDEKQTPLNNIEKPKKVFFLLPYFLAIKRKLNFPKQNLNHSKKVFLTIAFILLIILVTSVFFAMKRKEDAKTEALFASIFPTAQQKFDEGQSLIGLNKNLAREDFSKAKEILLEAKNKFKPDSKEEKQITELLFKVESSLSSALEAYNTQGSVVEDKESKILSFEKSNPSALFLTQDSKTIYLVDEKGVSSIDKESQKGKQIIKNDEHWSSQSGIGVYLGNIYILDKNGNQILKFSSGSYNKNDYLVNSVDFSNASSMSIDGSIYVLFKNGSITKFIKGKQESFSVTGLDKPLSNPSKIYTDVDIDNIYILDNGNSRIVVLDKKGDYKSQYSTSAIKNAKDFEVLEPSKKIFILSDNKIYQIDLK